MPAQVRNALESNISKTITQLEALSYPDEEQKSQLLAAMARLSGLVDKAAETSSPAKRMVLATEISATASSAELLLRGHNLPR